MKVNLKRSKILNAVKTVRGIVPGRPVQPIIGAILIECTQDNKVKFITTDLNLGMCYTIEGEVIKAGQTAINAKFLEEIISKLPDSKEVTLEVNEETNTVKVQGDKTKYEVVTMKAEEFPNILNSKKLTEGGVEKTFEIDSKELNRSIKQTAFAAVQTETNVGVLGGVSFSIEENILEMAATDGNRLTRSRIAINSKGETIAFICPHRTMVEISRVLSLVNDETVKFTIKGPKIIFEFQDIIFQSGLMEGTYPKYQQLIPTTNDKMAAIYREKLIDAIDRASVMVNDSTNIMKFLFENPNMLTVSADKQEAGSAKETLEIDYPEEELLIAFNYKYVLDCLRNMSEERIKIEMSTSLSAAVIKPCHSFQDEKTNDYLCLIMPVQVRR